MHKQQHQWCVVLLHSHSSLPLHPLPTKHYTHTHTHTHTNSPSPPWSRTRNFHTNFHIVHTSSSSLSLPSSDHSPNLRSLHEARVLSIYNLTISPRTHGYWMLCYPICSPITATLTPVLMHTAGKVRKL